jgi:renalase
MNRLSSMKTVIVGAGITGLTIGSFLRERFPKSEVVVLEKSRGVGGRIATRRTDLGKFDHGAQFYTVSKSIETLHERWQTEGLVKKWFDSESGQRFMSPNGMTALAKSLAANLSIELGVKVLKVNSTGTQGWEVEIENHRPVIADRIVMTAPMPQNLEILDRSGIPIDARFRAVKYAKAIVLLFEGVSGLGTDGAELDGQYGFKKGLSENVFSVANQLKKGLHGIPSWTVVMSPAFSDLVFEKSDEEILSLAVSEVKTVAPGIKYENAQVKKWRYSHPVSFACSKNEPLFSEVADGLFLAGDAFGGASVAGAVGSAVQLAERLSFTKPS